ncbi:MAG TPA: hypothetical protein VGK73_34650 [Polyangiaceae bacterium]
MSEGTALAPASSEAAPESPTSSAPESARVAEHDDAQPAPARDAFTRRRRLPVLGPSLVTSGTLLWAYVAFGDLVVAAGFPEFLALLAVLAIFAGTALACGRESLALLPAPPELELRRLATPGLAGFGLVFLTVLLVAAAARTSRASADSLITLFLLAVAGTAALVGRRLTGPAPRHAKPARRALALVGRIAGALLTLVVVARTLTRL